MVPITILLALSFVRSVTMAEPELEHPFDHEQFCVAAQDIARRANSEQGKWLDEYTRHDGMIVNCETRTVDLKLYAGLPFKEIPGKWQDRMDYKWSNDYCTDPAWAAAINHRWKITLTIHSTITTELFSSRADCH